jgi:hypothetical protein
VSTTQPESRHLPREIGTAAAPVAGSPPNSGAPTRRLGLALAVIATAQLMVVRCCPTAPAASSAPRPPRSSTCRPSTSASPQHRHRLRSDLDRPGRHRSPEPARPGQIVFERATCWTDPPRVTACVSGLLAQMIIPPWVCQLRRLHGGTTGQGPADDCPITAIATEITATSPKQDEGDRSAPPRPRRRPAPIRRNDHRPRRTPRDGHWPGGIREYIPDARPGTQQPVPLSPRTGITPATPALLPDEHRSGQVRQGHRNLLTCR